MLINSEFNSDFDASDELTTAGALEILETFYTVKLKPLGDHAEFGTVAGTVEITHAEVTAIFWTAYKMREIQNARGKGGKSGGGGRPLLPVSKIKPASLKRRERRAKKENPA